MVVCGVFRVAKDGVRVASYGENEPKKLSSDVFYPIDAVTGDEVLSLKHISQGGCNRIEAFHQFQQEFPFRDLFPLFFT